MGNCQRVDKEGNNWTVKKVCYSLCIYITVEITLSFLFFSSEVPVLLPPSKKDR